MRLWWVALLGSGCALAPQEEIDDTGVVDVVCDPGVPRQSWETFGQGFVVSQCQGCHASTTINRFGAPEGVVFDTEEDVIRQAARVLARATGPDADMPPAGGPTQDDRVRLERWLTCDVDLVDP